jgi:4-amino-4-deoxy-L-arabinose transferase-like glycosyltransferase
MVTTSSILAAPGAATPDVRPEAVQKAAQEMAPDAGRAARLVRSAWLWLPLVCAGQVLIALRPGTNPTAFEDEGLYVYMGHRMLDHLLHGAFLQEFPGSYFSGAPGVYPPLAALADSAGGLPAARGVSLAFVLATTVATHGLARRLFGPTAGLLAAPVFALGTGVIFQSHLATYDAMMMALVAMAAWAAVRSAQDDALLCAPLVAVPLALAALTKYAGAVYVPMVVALAVVVAWPRIRWLAVRRGALLGCAAGVVFFFVIQLWGRDLVGGIRQTTLDRMIINPAGTAELLGQLARWTGPAIALAALGAALRPRRQWAPAAVLLVAAVIGPAQQVHLGEATSLAKHTAFGMVFAAPLVGALLADVLRRSPAVVLPVSVLSVAAILLGLGVAGVHQATGFATGWVDDRPLVPVLRQWVRAQPGAPIMGEQPSPLRYALREDTQPRQWNDTYNFSFNGKTGRAAYADAVRLHYFGTIYLSSTTDYGAYLLGLLTSPDRDRYYNIKAKVPRYLRGERVGEWLVLAPRSVQPASVQQTGARP